MVQKTVRYRSAEGLSAVEVSVALLVIAVLVVVTLRYVREQHHRRLQADANASPAEVFEFTLKPSAELNDVGVPTAFICDVRNPTLYSLDFRPANWAIGIDSDALMPTYNTDEVDRNVYWNTFGVVIVSEIYGSEPRNVEPVSPNARTVRILPGESQRYELKTPVSLLGLRPIIWPGEYTIGLFANGSPDGRLMGSPSGSPWAEYAAAFVRTDE